MRKANIVDKKINVVIGIRAARRARSVLALVLRRHRFGQQVNCSASLAAAQPFPTPEKSCRLNACSSQVINEFSSQPLHRGHRMEAGIKPLSAND